MTECHVIGNGVSRLGKNLNYPVTYGCNALYRDFMPTYLVACDERMVKEILECSCNIWTRPNLAKKYNLNSIPDLPYIGEEKWQQQRNWGSGVLAVWLAIQHRYSHINLIGFDLDSSNCYQGTKNYLTKGPSPAFWIKQLDYLQMYAKITYK